VSDHEIIEGRKRGEDRVSAAARRLGALLLALVGALAALAGGGLLAGEAAALPWSFRPLARPPVPEGSGSWGASPVDCFILEQLRAAGLEPSPAASRAHLVRRLHLDLLGLPPAPEEVARFAADERPDAWERLVERALASPRFGERWGRHWLDAVRFAESDGFETNHERPDAWRYRDWVVDALNADHAYDRFVFEQIAGDSAATGFLVGGPRDIVSSPDPVLTAMQRQDELADIINTTGTAFLGLTLGCARCHDHKFDPVPQADYYALQAVFAGVRHGSRPLPAADQREREEEARALEARASSLRAELEEREEREGRERQEGQEGQETWSERRTLILDDEDLEPEASPARPAERAPHVVLLRPPAGHGTNPAGAERGRRDDAGGGGRLPNLSRGRYTWWKSAPGADLIAYLPRPAGRFRLWLSWGAGFRTHTRDARYLLDLDGDPATRGDQRPIATIDEQRFAGGEGEPAGEPLWSGLEEAGAHDLALESAIMLRAGESGTAVTADAIVIERAPAAEGGVPRALPHLRARVSAKRNEERVPPAPVRFVRFTSFATHGGLEPAIDELEIWSGGPSGPGGATGADGVPGPARNLALAALGARARSSGDYAGDPKHRLEHVHDGLHGNGRSWISSERGRGWVEIELAEPALIERIVWGRDREETYTDRLAVRYAIDLSLDGAAWRRLASSDDRAPYEIPAGGDLALRLAHLSPEEAARGREVIEEVARLEARRDALLAPPAGYAGRFEEPGPTHLLHRGEPLAKREAIAPGAVSALGTLALPGDTPEGERRAALARWIVGSGSSLAARVVVNRIWQHHFGAGIVPTPSDFGANGIPPSHPELLDWLATELIRSGWSLKHVHRLILLSSTYRQASAPRERALAADADARLLWRFPPRRLEAEAIRDGILSVSGALDLAMGGPSFSVFEPNANYARHWLAREDALGPGEWRRSLYSLGLRMERDGVFGSFDAPDGGQVSPRRNRSTTPVQALNLFNSAFVSRQAEIFAARLEREAMALRAAGDAGGAGGTRSGHAGDAAWRVRRAFLLALAREPEREESAAALALVEAHGLAALCRALFNANELLFVP
jgi:hypothetical protein